MILDKRCRLSVAAAVIAAIGMPVGVLRAKNGAEQWYDKEHKSREEQEGRAPKFIPAAKGRAPICIGPRFVGRGEYELVGYEPGGSVMWRTPLVTRRPGDHGVEVQEPDPARLNNIHWVRVGYDVSMERGSTDVDAAYRLYKPAIERYAQAGKKVMLVLTHETFGEGAGYVWPQMDSGKWRELTNKFVNVV